MAMRFEDLNVRQKAKDLTIKVYQIFKEHRDFSFKDQIQRASVSIMNNLAEGYDRGTQNDRKRFFIMAKGSAAEVRSMIILGKELHYFDEEEYTHLIQSCEEISKMLYGLIQSCKS